MAQFINFGRLEIKKTGDEGIQNEMGKFSNEKGGIISIRTTGLRATMGNGIFNTKNAWFDNHGTLNIVKTGDDGIENSHSALFMNDDRITIEQTGQNNVYGDGIHNHTFYASWKNKGIILIKSVGDDGIYNQNTGVFRNNRGEINICQTGQHPQVKSGDGILNEGQETYFANSGQLTIQQTQDKGIQNEQGAIFENATIGTLSRRIVLDVRRETKS